jgi:hypothetical protein
MKGPERRRDAREPNTSTIAVAGVVLATIVAVLHAIQDSGGRLAEGLPAMWWPLLRLRLVQWSLWAVVAVPVLLLVRRFPAERRLLSWLPAWLAAGLAAGVVHSAAYVVIGRVLGWLPVPPPPSGAHLGIEIAARSIRTFASNLLIFMLIALAIVATTDATRRRGD